METYFNLNIVKVLGLLITIVATVTLIFSIVTVIVFRKKNEFKNNSQIEIDNKKRFELLTPVVLKRIENVTKIIEEKTFVKPVETDPDPVIEEVESPDLTKKDEAPVDELEIKKENGIDAKEEEQRDISERYKIENRFLKNPKTD